MKKLKNFDAGSGLGAAARVGPDGAAEASGETQERVAAVKAAGTTDVARFGAATRIAAYARVSTQLQEREQTVQSQIDALRGFAADHGGELPDEAVFIDEGFSGSTMVRPRLDSLRDRVADGRYEVVLVYDPDRLARSYVYQMLLLEEFSQHACELLFVRRPVGKNPDEHLLLQMQGVIAEYERAKIAERTRRGKVHRMRQGELVTGRRTFGYRYVPRQGDVPANFQIIDDEAAVIRQIFSWYTEQHLAMRQIALRLNEAGIKTVRGNRFRASNLRQILTNSMYTGTGYAHRIEAVLPRDKPLHPVYRKYAKTGKRERPREQWLPFQCPAIISEETFELAQERLSENKRLSSRRTQAEYLLRGLIRCPMCGKHMMADSRSRRYFCPYSRERYAAEQHAPVCANTVRFPVDALDRHVWDETAKLIRKPSLLKAQYKQLHAKVSPKVGGGPSALRAKKSKLDDQLTRLNSLYIRGMLSEPDHRERFMAVKDQLATVEKQLQKLQHEELQDQQIAQMLSSFTRFSRSIRDEISQADFDTRRYVVEQTVKCVTIAENDVSVEFAVPLDTRTLCTVSCDR